MGLKRLLWRSTMQGRITDTVLNIKAEGNLVNGIKRTIKEDITEDNPLTKAIYNVGKYDGKIEGYAAASNEYEEKLLKQADEFIKQKRVFESEQDAYEELLNEYEVEIDNLTKKLNKTEIENVFLQELLLRERKLRQLL